MRPPLLPYLHNYVNPSGFSESYCRGTAKRFLETVECLFLFLVNSWVYFFRWLRREVTDSIKDKGKNSIIISCVF